MTMRPSPAKFLFDNDFAKTGGSKPAVAVAEHAAKIREAETAAHARGFAEAQAVAKTEAPARAAAALERIAATLQSLDRNLAAVEKKLEAEAVEVAVAVARKLAPALVAREPLAEISALATDCF